MSAQPPERPPTSAASMYRAIVGVGALCALVIVSVFQATAARIRENQQRFLERAVAEVLPEATTTVGVTLAGEQRLEKAGAMPSPPAFLGYDDDGRLIGAIVNAEGIGYQDKIRVLYAYSLRQQAITGFKVLDSKETPGLGDRIEKEAHFLANFERLDASLGDDRSALANPIVTVKQGEKTRAWQIDGITGATITSEAIGTILNESANRWAPALVRDADRFTTLDTTGEP